MKWFMDKWFIDRSSSCPRHSNPKFRILPSDIADFTRVLSLIVDEGTRSKGNYYFNGHYREIIKLNKLPDRSNVLPFYEGSCRDHVGLFFLRDISLPLCWIHETIIRTISYNVYSPSLSSARGQDRHEGAFSRARV